MSFQHVVLWIDHHEARLFGLAPNLVHKSKVKNDGHHFHRDHDSLGSRHERDRTYFAAVSEAVAETPEILLLGPGPARTEFLAWLQDHKPAQVGHILGNQACDDTPDEELVAKGRHFFHAADRMLPAR